MLGRLADSAEYAAKCRHNDAASVPARQADAASLCSKRRRAEPPLNKQVTKVMGVCVVSRLVLRSVRISSALGATTPQRLSLGMLPRSNTAAVHDSGPMVSGELFGGLTAPQNAYRVKLSRHGPQ